MKKCKNIECIEIFDGKKVYCSLKCRNYYVNKYIRDYSKISNTVLTKKENKILIYNENPNLCGLCNKVITYDKKINKFCSPECVKENIKINNPSKILDEEKKIIKNNKIKKTLILKGKENVSEKYKIKQCIYCNNEYKSTKKIQKYCSVNCSNLSRCISISNISTYKEYKLLTKFKFDLKLYPNEYDFNLIKEHGWYSAKNRGNNLNGVSRDHIISVNYGYKNNINPLILAHPANCQLLQHNDNVKKMNSIIITIDELLDKIKKWDIKYGNYYNFKLDTYINIT